MTEHNGIDILCDAAGSDLLLSSFLTPSSPAPEPQQRTKRIKVADEDGASPTSPHTRMPALTNVPGAPNDLIERGDLLTRHETTHDRDDGGKGRPIIRRSDRASEACVNCAASKAKCDDQKPCGRCKTKNLPCQTAAKRGSIYGISDSQSSETSVGSPGVRNTPAVVADAQAAMPLPMERRVQFPADQEIDVQTVMAPTPYSTDFVPHPLATDDMFFFNPTHNFYQDMDFSSWDMNFDSYTIPQVDITGPSPQSSTASTSKGPPRDPTRGYAAFKRSPWLWEPKSKDSLGNEQEGLAFNEKSIAHSPAYERILASKSSRWKMEPAIRDKLFALVLSQHKHPTKIPSFPSLELLNYLLQAHFIQDEYQTDSWIHSVSFDPSSAIPELLGALIASGATFIADPAIWRFGLSLQEVVRMGISATFESNNSMTRDLQCLQTFTLELDIGLWSGFKRKIEMAESFLLPPLTMLRRAGTFSAGSDSPGPIPLASDSPQELEAKWRSFIERESYKRLLLHIFFRDAQASIMLQHGTLLSYTELCFSLPAARDLWRAPTAEAWREIYLRKKPLPSDVTLPRVADIMHSITMLDLFEEFVDVELCYGAVLYGFWGQIHAYREAVKFYDHQSATSTRRTSRVTHRLWLTSQHQELYRDVSEFAMLIGSSPKLATQLSVVAELFMMMLHVSPDELQRFAGKQGEDEARQAASHLEDHWEGSRDARHAIWHAGQVIRHARTLPPASLRAFNAIAVYYASLTLWIYGLLSCSHSTATKNTAEMPAPPTYVLVDGNESRETRAFLQLDKGTPGISMNGDVHSGVESLSNTGMVLNIARNVFRDNFPVRTEPLPPLVESLGNLLRDLGTGLAGLASRVQSRAVSEDRD
ncbi:hypothetical protein PFICI_09908 [Pestalotiopsis fici W106-1]|uniref:Zn(2)-C6 fungal-type domain-containing protein n=1 Tax=Pestalotiopsis fici (strain W106-1 / CGMCC3.15140) TaxID=1229662 RepID=W3WY81_PESFW|nr:uncharacterized protein PFICI_09908 [Pestalotiopsis fici W106-1]ETS77846.1 hypothetical protein PFICI_09908 [Pestalotiopsis fici W106-1]